MIMTQIQQQLQNKQLGHLETNSVLLVFFIDNYQYCNNVFGWNLIVINWVLWIIIFFSFIYI